MAPISRSRLNHAHRTPSEELGSVHAALLEPFHLDPLPFDYSGLEPVMDRETMHWHHDVHHREYVERLNRLMPEVPVHGIGLEEILRHVSRFSTEIRECAGGHWNHAFFWSVMTDQKENQELTPEVLSAIERNFLSFENFKTHFIQVGASHVGSGWVWLIKTDADRLAVVTTMNQDNPLMDVAEAHGEPILGCDLWEHAYYLKYKAKREDYLRKFFSIVNWSRVHALFIGPYH